MRVVLLVEDDSNDEMLALRALKQAPVSVKVDVVRDGVEALDYLLDPEKPCPDLVLLDLKLPRLSGIEVLKSLRASEKTCRVPVIVFASSNERDEVGACLDNGANSFVRKAVDLAEHMEKVSKLVDYWLNVNETCHDQTPKPAMVETLVSPS